MEYTWLQKFQMKTNYCGFAIDPVYWCDGSGEGFYYRAYTKFGYGRFIGFNIRLGWVRFCFGKENRANERKDKLARKKYALQNR
jgi:hypothetical protein